MEKVCFIVGAGEYSEGKFICPPGSYLIAADGGYEHLKKNGMEADMVLGDFDSTDEPEHPNIVRHPVMKDDTDMLLAVKTGLQMGYRRFVLLGGLGGRLDHTLANIQTLVYIARRGGAGFLVGGGTAITAIIDSSFFFEPRESGEVSVFCSGSKAEGVYLKGLKYPLTDATLTDEMPLGVSNEFTGAASEITVREGTLVILWRGNLEKIIGI